MAAKRLSVEGRKTTQTGRSREMLCSVFLKCLGSRFVLKWQMSSTTTKSGTKIVPDSMKNQVHAGQVEFASVVIGICSDIR
jgi:hypothetical protein